MRKLEQKPLLIDDNTEYKLIKDHNTLFTKITQLLKNVYNSQSQINQEDILPFTTQNTFPPSIVKKVEQLQLEGKQNNVIDIFFKVAKKTYIIGGILFFLSNILSCVGIFFLDIVTDKLKNSKDENTVEIVFYLLSMIAVFFLKSYFSSKQNWYNIIWRTEAQASLQYILFKKSLKTKQFAGKNKNVGADQQQANINNLMTSDMSQVLFFYWATHSTWIYFIMIVVILLMIYYKLKDAIVNGLYVFAGACVYNMLISYLIQWFSRKKYIQKDKRISLSSDVIEGIKSIKYLSWEKIFEKKINDIRSQEFKYLFGTRLLDGVLAIFWNSISYFLLFAFLVTFINKGHQLMDSNVFTIIALFNFLTYPLGMLPWSISALLRVRVSINRINKFFLEKEIDENEYVQPNFNNNKTDFNTTSSDSLNNNDENFISEKNQQNKIINQNLAIQITNMKFQWPRPSIIEDASKKKDLVEKKIENKDNTEFTLYLDNLQIEKSKLTFIIGRIGGGKSALCQSILNEMDIVNPEGEQISYSIRHSSVFGPEDSNYDKFQLQSINSDPDNRESVSVQSKQQKFQINGQVAYVSQVHWLQNRSIKENILFGKYYDEKLYNQCIRICQLKQDLKTFNKGDQKLVGPGGSNLSGGQRQRVALCRAIYQDCDIYLFDDIFSSLDAHVADAIFQQVIKEFLLQNGKTVILITSHYRFLKEQNCNILFVDNGRVFKDQEIFNSYVQEKLKEETQKLEEQAKKDKNVIMQDIELFDEEDENSQIQSSKQDQKTQLIDLLSSENIDNNNNKNKSGEQQLKQIKKIDNDDEQEEQREQGSVKKDTIMTYILAMTIFLIICLLIFNFLMQFSRTAIDFWLRSEITPGNTGFDFLNDMFNDDFAAIFTFLISINVAITFIRVCFYVACAQLAAYRLFHRLNKSILFSKMKFFDTNSNGRIINRLSSDVETVDLDLPWACHVFLEHFAQSFGLSLGIVIQFPWMVILIVIAVVLIYYVQNLFRVANREIRRLSAVNEGIVLTHIGEVCKGLIIIRSFNKSQNIIQEYIKKMSDNITAWVMSQVVLSWMQIRLWYISNIIMACVGLTCILLLIFQENFEYSTVAMTLTYSLLLTDCFSQLVFFLSGTEQRFISVERERQYFDNEQEDLFNVQNLKNQNTNIKKQYIEAVLSQEDLRNNSIIFQNVFLTYDNINNTNQEQLQYSLKNINLKIKIGEKVAFCGRTGSGKTSILNCLFKMYPLYDGNIYVKGQSIQNLSLYNLRSQISIIPQFGFLYSASLKENLDPENKFSKEEVQHIIKDSKLEIRQQRKEEEKKSDGNNINHEAVNITADSDFVIEQSGGNLSCGEKQIINYLRIVLLNKDIICLDEATSNMDPQTDALLHDKLFEFSEGKTLIVITHRLENIDKFDRVVVLEKGEIIEQGHVTELRNKKGGFFNRLMKHQ